MSVGGGRRGLVERERVVAVFRDFVRVGGLMRERRRRVGTRLLVGEVEGRGRVVGRGWEVEEEGRTTWEEELGRGMVGR